MAFQDHFSNAARAYAESRPHYPDALYEAILAHVPGRRLAWDCATGSGQAAVALAKHFDRVVATDASESQLEHAIEAERVEYRTALAADSGLEDDTVDLVTVAAALHWFAEDSFYDEVRRVVRPGGVLAGWSYAARMSVNDEVDAAILQFGGEVLGPHWPSDMVHNISRYETLPFPFELLDMPELHARATWTRDQLKAFVRTWSGYQRFVASEGRTPDAELDALLDPAWGDDPSPRDIRWPLHFRVGRVT